MEPLALLTGQRLVAVDTETTGLSPNDGHALIEVATVSIDDGVIAEPWSSLIQPGRPIPPDATAVHGITDAMVAEAPAPAGVIAELRRRCGDATLVFHNASFDLPFLNAELRRAGEPPLFNPIVDTLGLARAFPGQGGNSLGALAARFGLPVEPRHRAPGDALTTARLFVELVRRGQQDRKAASLAELAAASQDLLRQAAARGPTSGLTPAPSPR
jgi:DNA polymerase-3 subunit epsilon